MAAPLLASAKLLIKPILNKLKKDAIKKAAETGALKATGLTLEKIEKLSNIDVLNLVRAKAVKGTKTQVANSLGISVKDLNETLKSITLTETRKKAVKGKNYIANANRFLNNPVKTIGTKYKSKIISDTSEKASKYIDDKTDKKEKIANEIELELLQRDLFSHSTRLKLSSKVFLNSENINIDTIMYLREKVQADQYYEAHGIDFFIETLEFGGKGGGYQMAKLTDEYMNNIERLLLNGYTITKINGIL